MYAESWNILQTLRMSSHSPQLLAPNSLLHQPITQHRDHNDHTICSHSTKQTRAWTIKWELSLLQAKRCHWIHSRWKTYWHVGKIFVSQCKHTGTLSSILFVCLNIVSWNIGQPILYGLWSTLPKDPTKHHNSMQPDWWHNWKCYKFIASGQQLDWPSCRFVYITYSSGSY